MSFETRPFLSYKNDQKIQFRYLKLLRRRRCYVNSSKDISLNNISTLLFLSKVLRYAELIRLNQLTVNIQYKYFPMTGFEPRTSGVGSGGRSTNWATPLPIFLVRHAHAPKQTLLNFVFFWIDFSWRLSSVKREEMVFSYV